MFWKMFQPELKVGGPIGIPAYIGRHLVKEMQKFVKPADHWVRYRMVIRPQAGKVDTYDVRVIDEWEERGTKREITVTGYDFLDTHPELIEFEGWFNAKTHHVEITAKVSALSRSPEKA
jgi:hypothetical protein